jgi:hypothetical protein
MKIQPVRQKTPVSVRSSWPVQGTTAKRSNPSNSASFQDIENFIMFFYSIYFQVQIVVPDYN